MKLRLLLFLLAVTLRAEESYSDKASADHIQATLAGIGAGPNIVAFGDAAEHVTWVRAHRRWWTRLEFWR